MKFLLAFLLFTSFSFACNVDVIIANGATVNACIGSSVTLNATTGFASYNWTGPQTGTSDNLTVTQSGQYIVYATDALACVSTDTIQVTFNTPQNAVINSSEGNMICPGSAGTILSVAGTFNSFLWSNNSTQGAIQVTQAGTYSVQATDASGCVSNAAIFISMPNFNLNANPATVCNGNSAGLIASGGSSYVWSTNELTSMIFVAPAVETTYWVEITMGACVDTLYQTVNVINVESQQIPNLYVVKAGDDIFIKGPSGFDSYTWTPAVDLTSYSGQNTTFTGDTSVTYVVTSTHAGGCIRVDTVHVKVIQLSVPTGFSPNGDMYNESFRIPEMDTIKGTLVVWNRWGEIVYETFDYKNDWKGTCEGKICVGGGDLPDGTYFYEIRIEDLKFNGYTTIKR